MRKVLIVFYSKTGNVRLLVQKAAQLLDADIEELIDQSKWTGVDGFFRRAHRSIVKGDTTLSVTRYNPKDYEKILVFSPLWAATIAPAVRTYLKQNADSIHELSLVALGGFSDSSGAEKEVEGMGFKLKGVLGLLDSGQRGQDINTFEGDNVVKLEEFIKRTLS